MNILTPKSISILLSFIILVMNDWNRNVIQFTGSITENLNTDTIMSIINGQYYDNEGKGKENIRGEYEKDIKKKSIPSDFVNRDNI